MTREQCSDCGPAHLCAVHEDERLRARIAELEAELSRFKVSMSDAVDAVQKERDAWANAIRTVARGAIPSPEAARAAITELLIALERKGLASDAYLAKCEAADKAEERASELRVALQDARELAEAGWSYADSYYREKWDYEKRLAELDAVLQVTTQKIEHVGDQGQFLAITGGKPCKK